MEDERCSIWDAAQNPTHQKHILLPFLAEFANFYM